MAPCFEREIGKMKSKLERRWRDREGRADANIKDRDIINNNMNNDKYVSLGIYSQGLKQINESNYLVQRHSYVGIGISDGAIDN